MRVLAAMEMRALGAYAGRHSARLLSKHGKNLFQSIVKGIFRVDSGGRHVLCTKSHGEIPSGFF